jgi:predicted dehydrogenase
MVLNKYRYAVIGFGRRGRALNRAIQSLTDVEAQCVAVADIREPTEEEKELFGRSFYSDYSEMLAKEKLNFVIVAGPACHHVKHALAALKYGLPVYLEKPVSDTWEGAVRLYRAVIENGFPLFMGYNLRRFPAVLAMKEVMDAREIGQLQSVLAHVNTGSQWAGGVEAYYRVPPFSNVIIGKLTHDTDTIQHCLGTEAATCNSVITRSVWTSSQNTPMDDGDTCCATGLFTNGAVYSILLTTVGPDYERRYILNGTDGQLDVIIHSNRPDSEPSAILWRNGREPHAVKLPGTASGSHGGADPRVVGDFLEWLGADPDKPHDPRSILTGMIIPTAALESARTGRRISCTKRLLQAMEV